MPTQLQRLITDYLRDHPGENLSSIARRGSGGPGDELPRSTVHALKTRGRLGRVPHADTIRRLAKGLGMPEQRVRDAIAQSIGHVPGGAHENPEIELLLATVRGLDPERLDAVLRRARLLEREMLEEKQANSKRRRK